MVLLSNMHFIIVVKYFQENDHVLMIYLRGVYCINKYTFARADRIDLRLSPMNYTHARYAQGSRLFTYSNGH